MNTLTADPACKNCHGRGWYYDSHGHHDIEYSQTVCECTYQN